ncbi:MAG: serine/threonine-protein kinase [Chrysiogenales bacterium]
MAKCPTCGFANAVDARFCVNCGYEFTQTFEPPPDHRDLFQSEIDPIKEKLIEKYQILHFIGKGGFSTVFLLKDKALDRFCALKILSRDHTIDKESVERFKREARLYASLDHPNIVSVYDFGFHNHVAYIIFKYIDGMTLHEYIKRHHPLKQAEIVAIACDLADILCYLHQRGVIHRDVKPDNVMIQSCDRKVILADFGLAKKLNTSTVTSDGKVMGSPHYFSPEQAKGEPVDARSDIYSLGITIYEMISGIVPFKGDTPFEVILKHIHEPIPNPALARPDLHPELHRLIRRCTEKDPRRRFQEALELKAALERIPPVEIPEMKTEIIKHGSRGRRLHAWPAIGVAMVAASILIGVYLVVSKGETRPTIAKESTPDIAKTMPKVMRVSPDDPFASLLLEAQAGLARGDLALARGKAAVARKLKAGKEIDELDEQIRIKTETGKWKQPGQTDRQKEEPQPTERGKVVVDKKPDPNEKKPVLQDKAPIEASSKKIETGKKPDATAIQFNIAEKSKPVEVVKMIDLPGTLCQQYIKDLEFISSGALAEEIKISGTISLVLRIDEAGSVSLESANGSGVKIEPESRLPEILSMVEKRINGIKVQPPVSKTGAAVRIESWRIAFRIGRDRQSLVLARIN